MLYGDDALPFFPPAIPMDLLIASVQRRAECMSFVVLKHRYPDAKSKKR